MDNNQAKLRSFLRKPRQGFERILCRQSSMGAAQSHTRAKDATDLILHFLRWNPIHRLTSRKVALR